MKKVLSVALALVMALSCFALVASATTTKAVLEISVEPTATSYSKGDVVTFEVFYETSDELGLLGAAFYMQFGYDSSVFETIEDISADTDWSASTTFISTGYPADNNIDKANSSIQSRTGATLSSLANLSVADKAKGWDSVLSCIQTPDDGPDDDYSTKTAAFAFKLKVKEDAADDGSYTVGVTDWAINNFKCEVDEEIGSIAGPSGTDYEFENPTMFATNDATVTIAAVAPDFAINHVKDQIRFRGITYTSGAADYEGKFDVRTIAEIPTDVMNYYFGGEAGATAADGITDFGFVYAKTSKVSAFDVDTAKSVAEGATVANYTKKSVVYMQRTATGYQFSCLVAGINDADKTDGYSCLAYVCYGGDYYYMDAAVAVSFNTLYTQHMPTV